MGKAYSTLGGSIPNADVVSDLTNFASQDISPLTLLNDEDSMTKLTEKVNEAKGKLEEIITNLTTHAGEMQAEADAVNGEGKVQATGAGEW